MNRGGIERTQPHDTTARILDGVERNQGTTVCFRVPRTSSQRTSCPKSACLFCHIYPQFSQCVHLPTT